MNHTDNKTGIAPDNPKALIFSRFEDHDICPYNIKAFRVINSKAAMSTLYKTAGRDNYALTYVLEGSFTYYFNETSFRSDDSSGNDVQTIECRAREMTFLPVGAVYHHENKAPASMYVLYFSIAPDIPSEYRPSVPVLLKTGDSKRFGRLFEDTFNKYMSTKRSALDVKSSLCSLLSALAAEEELGRHDKGAGVGSSWSLAAC